MRKGIIKIFLGEDLIARADRFSYKKNGFVKVSIANVVCLTIFLGIYIILDGAGTLPASFCLMKGGISLLCNFILSIIVTNILSPYDRK
jgi:divalent metal cation (Fe/Co/Zn/Cd) transporter